ncbi:hypothetical protein Ddc_22056 [Ditylenchus destructor]|nr:hypothetical protein Ddc_22056 [Ditylenchus destructor]
MVTAQLGGNRSQPLARKWLSYSICSSIRKRICNYRQTEHGPPSSKSQHCLSRLAARDRSERTAREHTIMLRLAFELNARALDRQAVRDTRSLCGRLSLHGPLNGRSERFQGPDRLEHARPSAQHAILCVLALKTATRVLKAGTVSYLPLCFMVKKCR